MEDDDVYAAPTQSLSDKQQKNSQQQAIINNSNSKNQVI